MAARNAAGEGPESTVQRVLSASMPTAVGQPVLIASSCSAGSLTLKWTVPEDDGGCPVTRYRILRDNVVTGTEVPSTTVSYFTAGAFCLSWRGWVPALRLGMRAEVSLEHPSEVRLIFGSAVVVRNCLDNWGSDSPYLETYTASLPGQVTGLNAGKLLIEPRDVM